MLRESVLVLCSHKISMVLRRWQVFFSQLHVGAQKNYSTTEQEILGVIKAVEHFRQYLISSKFKIRTDHQALIFLLKKEHEKKRLAR